MNGMLGEAVGQMYVEKSTSPLPPKNVWCSWSRTCRRRWANASKILEWMGDSTKAKAIEKLNSFYVKVGYPDKWRDYTALDVEKRLLLGKCETCH
mgnify:CR=1 FL=1